jgi:hypothetical protein
MFMNGFVFVMPGALGLQLVDPLQYFSWGIYAGAGVLYSALSFTGELSKEGALIFSKRNARSLSWIFAIHTLFLVTLIGLMRVAPFIYPSLPNWMTDLFPHQNPPLSAFDLVFVLVIIGLSRVERRWLYRESETESRDREPTSAKPSARKEE